LIKICHKTIWNMNKHDSRNALMKNKNKNNINIFVERKNFSTKFIASYTFDTLNYMLYNHHIKFYFPSKKIWLKKFKN